MARKVKDKALDTREARGKLKPQGKPYWRVIERGLHIGYRRLKGKSGTWWARHYLGAQKYETEALGIADDQSDADGAAVIDYWQAQAKARDRMAARARAIDGKIGPLTVRDAIEEYLVEQSEKSSAYDSRKRVEALIYPALGSIECNALTADMLRRWHAALAKQPARVHTAEGNAQRYKSFDARARKVSANRTLMILKAALSRSWREGKIATDTEWRRVKPFERVDASRVRYLSVAEAKRLVNAADLEFRPVMQAALATGCRYGELTRLRVADFNDDVGTITIRQSKSGKSRHVVLSAEGQAFFRQLAAGRGGDAILLAHTDGRPYAKSHQARPMTAACARARITPRVSFHSLRHTYASLSIMNDVPLLVLAKNLGHADMRMIEKHYGHLAPSYIADEIRRGAPQFGLTTSNVRALRK
jgi:integrase